MERRVAYKTSASCALLARRCRQQAAGKTLRGKELAPQVGLEPTTLRLTADTVVAASHCKHKYLHARKSDFRVNWGDFGGTPVKLEKARQVHCLQPSQDDSKVYVPSVSYS